MSEAAAATTTPAATTTTTPATTTTTTPAATTEATTWTTGLDQETVGYIQNKGFKEPKDVLHSYRNLEKLVGVSSDRILKLPEKEDDPAWAGIHERLGVPKEAKEYKIEIPKEAGDVKLADAARVAFKEANLTAKQAEKIVKWWNDSAVTNSAAVLEQYKTQVTAEDLGLKKEWGAAYEQNINVAKHAFSKLGFDADMASKLEQVMGFGKVMRMFHGLGAKLGEDSFVGSGSGGGNGFGAMTPAQAKDKISALRGDPGFVKRYTSGDLSAKQEMERLHQMAYHDQVQ